MTIPAIVLHQLRQKRLAERMTSDTINKLDAMLLEKGSSVSPSFRVRALPAAQVLAIDPEELFVWCANRARYGLPTLELAIIDSVRCYAHVGNAISHSDKRALALPHREIREPWIASRSLTPHENIIYVWERNQEGAAP